MEARTRTLDRSGDGGTPQARTQKAENNPMQSSRQEDFPEFIISS
jgi:hypothetical protein